MKKTFNVAGASFTPSFARIAIAEAYRNSIDPRACHWTMSAVQKAMVESCAVSISIVEKKEVPVSEEETAAVELSHFPEFTLGGLAVIVAAMPNDLIELRFGNEILAEITNLSVPPEFR